MAAIKFTYNGIDITEHCDRADLERVAAALQAAAIPVPYICRRCGRTLGHVSADGVLTLEGADCTPVANAAAIECPTCGAQRKWYDIRHRARIR